MKGPWLIGAIVLVPHRRGRRAQSAETRVLGEVVARLAADSYVLHRVSRMLEAEDRDLAPDKSPSLLLPLSGYLTTAQAAKHLGFASPSAIRTA